jgi:hypothetical protein
VIRKMIKKDHKLFPKQSVHFRVLR